MNERLTRSQAVALLEDEHRCMCVHVANLQALRDHGGMPELHFALEQMERAVQRLGADLHAAQTARIQ